MTKTLWRLATNANVLALGDQAMVSAANFLATVMIGRWSGAAELGAYAIALSLIVSLQAVQESLISLPYTILRRDSSASTATHAGSSLVLSVLLSAVAVALLAAAGVVLSIYDDSTLAGVFLTLAVIAPFAMLREFGRRYAFSHLRMAEAAAIDGVAVALQIALLLALAWQGALTAVTASLALGASSGVAGALWFWHARSNFAYERSDVVATFGESWRLGKWLSLSQIVLQIQIYIPYWLTLAIAGPVATGVYSACMSIVALVNPLMAGLANIFAAKSVIAWKEGGGDRLRRQAVNDTLLLGGATGTCCAVAIYFGDELIQLFYPGDAYLGMGATVIALWMAKLASAIGLPPANALASMEEPQAVVRTGAIGAVLTALLVWLLTSYWGLFGAAIGVFAGHVAGSGAKWIALAALTMRRG